MAFPNGPDIRIAEFDMGTLKGVRGQPGKPLTADMGVANRGSSEVKPEWLREGADLSPTAIHRMARIGARFWNAGNETFRLGFPFETGPGVYIREPGPSAQWAVYLGKLWKFELLAGPEKDLQRAHNVQAIIAPTLDATGGSLPQGGWFDFQLHPAQAADALTDPYYAGMVFDLTGIADNDAAVPFYWFRMTFDPENKWGQQKMIEFKVKLHALEFLPYE